MDALASLRLQIEWGADEALAETPVSRLRAPDAVVRPAAAPEARIAALPARPGPDPGPRTQAAAAAAAAAATAARPAGIDEAADLAGLRTAISAFEGCALRDTATSTVLPAGTAAGGILVLGEVPDADEDRSGIPFAGRPGALLDRMLRSIGLDRDGVLLVPAIPWRPPGGRPPSPRELAICRPFLDRVLALAQPRFLLLMGGRPARIVLNGLPRPGAGWQRLPAEAGLPDTSRALAMRHPATLLGHLPARKEAWADLLRLRSALDSITDA